MDFAQRGGHQDPVPSPYGPLQSLHLGPQCPALCPRPRMPPGPGLSLPRGGWALPGLWGYGWGQDSGVCLSRSLQCVLRRRAGDTPSQTPGGCFAHLGPHCLWLLVTLPVPELERPPRCLCVPSLDALGCWGAPRTPEMCERVRLVPAGARTPSPSTTTERVPRVSRRLGIDCPHGPL